jgi:hypothetical protein
MPNPGDVFRHRNCFDTKAKKAKMSLRREGRRLAVHRVPASSTVRRCLTTSPQGSRHASNLLI